MTLPSQNDKHPSAKCHSCGKGVSRSGGSVTKVQNHLMRYHSDLSQIGQDKIQSDKRFVALPRLKPNVSGYAKELEPTS